MKTLSSSRVEVWAGKEGVALHAEHLKRLELTDAVGEAGQRFAPRQVESRQGLELANDQRYNS